LRVRRSLRNSETGKKVRSPQFKQRTGKRIRINWERSDDRKREVRNFKKPQTQQ